jgi:hypothetical protein
MLPLIGSIKFEQRPEWLKVTLPGQRNWLMLVLHTILLVTWLVSLVWIAGFLFRERGLGFVMIVLLVLWLLIWFWFGRKLWNMWQYHAADREILFINKEQLIVRRPVSILGPTDNYDMRYVTPFYYSDKHGSPAFDYAFQHVYFGHNLSENEAKALVLALNQRFFPDADDNE